MARRACSSRGAIEADAPFRLLNGQFFGKELAFL